MAGKHDLHYWTRVLSALVQQRCAARIPDAQRAALETARHLRLAGVAGQAAGAGCRGRAGQAAGAGCRGRGGLQGQGRSGCRGGLQGQGRSGATTIVLDH